MSHALGGPLRLPEGSRIPEIARALADAGGRALVVGGFVRDQLLGRAVAAPEFDLEVQRLSPDAIESVLSAFGEVRRVGRAFPIHLVKGLPIDVSLPRTDSAGADGSPPGFDPDLDFREAARGRDLRVNAMGWDPLTGELLDPHGGQRDVADGILRATDPDRFGRDPLRGLRTTRLAAVLEMDVDAELRALCGQVDLDSVAPERIFAEFRRLLLEAKQPSRGLRLLAEVGLLRFFPELDALVGVAQDPAWHPEGDVWVHTMMVVDVAADLRTGEGARDLLLMLGALCHDFGKPSTTAEHDGRIVSRRHDRAGTAPTELFLGRMRAPRAVVRGTRALVRDHLTPAQFAGRGTDPRTAAGPSAYRRLLRRLRSAGVDADLLWRVARADHLGRTTRDATAGVFPAGDLFLAHAADADRDPGTYRAAVTGDYLIANGVAPGAQVGELLERCRAIQDETGWTDAAAILARARSGARGRSG